MAYIALGTLGFLIIHLSDVVSLKRTPLAKPVIWLLGGGLLVYSIVVVCLMPDKLPLPVGLVWLGWPLLAGSLFLLIHSLYVSLPFRETYITSGVGDRLVTNGLYALVRHPWLYGFTLLMLSLVLVSRSSLMLVAAPIWISLDILLIIIQDRVFLGRMFPGYERYRRETPMLVPNSRSIAAFIRQQRVTKIKNQGGQVK